MENYEDLLLARSVPRFSAGRSLLRDVHVFVMAREMLLEGAPSRRVCAAVGYAHVPAFSRAWLRMTGLPPRAWQRMHGVKVRIKRGGRRVLTPRKTWTVSDLRKPRKPYTRRKHLVRRGEDVI